MGLVSDSHDNDDAVARAVHAFRQHGVAFVLHAGDVTEGRTLRAFAEWPGAVAWGNNDDARALAPVAEELEWAHGEAWRGELDGVCVGLVHGHRRGLLSRYLTKEKVDVLVRGHNHRVQDEVADDVRVLNPGALYRARHYSAAVWDTVSGRVTRVDVPKAR